MFGWLERWARDRRRAAMERVWAPYLKPISLVAAYGDIAEEYTRGVEAGRISYPAYKRELGSPRSSVVERWRDLVTETFIAAYKFGDGSLHDLAVASERRQIELLDALFAQSAREKALSPTNDRITDSIGCLMRAYMHLDKIGQEICDDACDGEALRRKGGSIYTEIMKTATQLRREWQQFFAAVDASKRLPDTPRTLFHLLLDDLNAKTKSLALTSVFGPDYQQNFRALVSHAVQADAGKSDPSSVLYTFEIIKRCASPDEAAAELAKLGSK